MLINSRHTTIQVDQAGHLKALTKALSRWFWRHPDHHDTASMVDLALWRVQTILDTHPNILFFNIMVTDRDRVRTIYKELYRKQVAYIAFYARKEDTVYFSATDLAPRIIAHELAHVVLHKALGFNLSGVAHEALAQWTEQRIGI